MRGRREKLEQLRQEQESLREEEARTPHREGLAFWLVADTFSGEDDKRRQRRGALARDLLLATHGYELLAPLFPTKDDPFMHLHTVITLDHQWQAGQISAYALHTHEISLLHWKRMLDEWAKGHHHVCCRRCQEPLLQLRDTSRALAFLHNHVHPAIFMTGDGVFHHQSYDKEIERLTRYAYRAVSQGPDSDPLDFCPECHHTLSSSTVQEIVWHEEAKTLYE